MRKLPQVEEARELMTEAMQWSVFTWLFQKSRVREVADRANAALDKLNQATKARWSDDLKAAHKIISGKNRRQEGPPVNAEIASFLKKVKEADDAARRARTDAEDIFEQAERQMNTDLAREGCKKAIHQWELDEKAIRRAEGFPGSGKTAT